MDFFKKAGLSLCVGLLAPVSYAQTYNATTFGAKGDGKTLNTRAIQAAIDRCFSQGGGEVIVPAGKYYTGTLFLKSRVYLHLMPGAVTCFVQSLFPKRKVPK